MLQGSGEAYITRSFMVCTVHPILFERLNREEGDGREGVGMLWHGMCVGKERCVQRFGEET